MDSYYSVWQSYGMKFVIVSNPEDDWATWSSDTDIRCNVVTRKKYTAVYRCEDKRVLRLKYDRKTGTLYINGYPFERGKDEFE